MDRNEIVLTLMDCLLDLQRKGATKEDIVYALNVFVEGAKLSATET